MDGIPLPSVTGGAAGPATSGGFFGNSAFQDGAFIVGSPGATASTPQSATLTTPQHESGFGSPVAYGDLFAAPSGLSLGGIAGIDPTVLIIGAACLVALLLFR